MIDAERTAGNRDRLVVGPVAVPVDVELVRVGRARIAVGPVQSRGVVFVNRRGHSERVDRRINVRHSDRRRVRADACVVVGDRQGHGIRAVIVRREGEG